MRNKGQRLPYYPKVRYADLKGIIERLFALIAVMVLLPILALISICVIVDSPGGAIFRQERVGKNGRRFIIYKFRTMRGTTDDDEYREILRKLVTEGKPHMFHKAEFQPRVTRVGAPLRKTNLDELPQLFNVIKGDMGLVGPRPDVPYTVEFYEDWMRRRLSIKPGMTGLWQVSGGNWLSFDEMVRLDIDYIERQSPLMDSKILLQTIGIVLGRDGSYREPKELRDD